MWPRGKASSVVAPGFIRSHLTFCEELRNNMTLDFPESPAPFGERHASQGPGCFHYRLAGMHGICYGSLRVALTPMQEWQKFDFWSPHRRPQYTLCFPPLPQRNQGGKWSRRCFNRPGNEDPASLGLFFPRQGYPVGMAPSARRQKLDIEAYPLCDPRLASWLCHVLSPRKTAIRFFCFLSERTGGHVSEGSCADHTNPWLVLAITCGFLKKILFSSA